MNAIKDFDQIFKAMELLIENDFEDASIKTFKKGDKTPYIWDFDKEDKELITVTHGVSKDSSSYKINMMDSVWKDKFEDELFPETSFVCSISTLDDQGSWSSSDACRYDVDERLVELLSDGAAEHSDLEDQPLLSNKIASMDEIIKENNRLKKEINEICKAVLGDYNDDGRFSHEDLIFGVEELTDLREEGNMEAPSMRR